jgi:hypothetical protein
MRPADEFFDIITLRRAALRATRDIMAKMTDKNDVLGDISLSDVVNAKKNDFKNPKASEIFESLVVC